MNGIGILLGIIGGVVLLIIAVIVISMYNSLVRLKHNIEKAWSNIDVLLKQRQDELTKLMESVKGFMKHEKGVLTEVTKARTAFMKAEGVKEKAQADSMTQSALKSLFAVAENYPQLKSNENFLQFQGRIGIIESQIADRREFYNDSVNTYNVRIEQIPYNFLANVLGYQQKDLFKVAETDRQDVKVSF